MVSKLDNRIKILFIHHGMGMNGAAISLLNLVKNLDSNKYKITVGFLIKDNNNVVRNLFERHGIKTCFIDFHKGRFTHNKSGKINFYYFWKYFRIIKEWRFNANHFAYNYLSMQNFDIVHLNSHSLTSWAYAAKILGKKVVLHNREAISRGYFGIRYRILKQLIEGNCDAVINISNDNKMRLGLGKNSHVVYNFSEIPVDFKPPMIQNNGFPKILYLGGNANFKGFDTSVNSLKHLSGNVTVQFAGNYGKIGGEKALKDKIKRFIKLTFYRRQYQPIKKLSEATNVEILGLLENSMQAIDNCDILITPFKIEHFSRPAIEAFSCGKPVIGANVEGMDEIIDHGINGLLVEKDDPKALADAINYLCENPELARKMGEKGREKAKKFFSPEANVPQVEAIYYQLMAKDSQ